MRWRDKGVKNRDQVRRVKSRDAGIREPVYLTVLVFAVRDCVDRG